MYVTNAHVVGCVEKVPVFCDSLFVPLDFVVVRNAPYDTIFERSISNAVRSNLDFWQLM